MDVTRCTGCGRVMRDRDTLKADAPDTVAVGAGGLCMSCYGRPTTATDDDAPCVLVRTDLRPSTYKVFAALAKREGVDIGAVLSVLADRAVKPGKPRRAVKRQPVPDDVDDTIRRLNGDGWSDNRIAQHLGMSQSAVSRRRRLMGLESPTPRPAGSGRRRAA